MTDLAHYAFLPWMRVGIAAEITETDTLGEALPVTTAKQRASVDVTLTLEEVSVTDGSVKKEPIAKTAQFIGPGDILGISRDAIVRTEPRDQVNNYEANCFPYVEFYEEDFPWRYTPAAPGAPGGKRLRPWVMLLALLEDEYTLTANDQGLAVVSIKPEKANEVFFPHTQSWAWAHVHFYHDLTQAPGTPAYAGEVTQTLSANPDAAVSRVLCPRKLRPEKTYRAFLIPAFETGRLAGLKEDPSQVLAQASSWEYGVAPNPARKRPYDFPVYHQWGFQTGLHGDFKSLAALLKPKVLDPKFGKRPMDISQPGFGMNTLGAALDSKTLGLEGALKPVGFTGDAWPKPGSAKDTAYKSRLKDLLNISTDLQTQSAALPVHPYYPTSLPADPIVTPHIYGKFHAFIRRLGAAGNPAWVETLNLDPRHRATAGLGSQVVQENQEEFMEAAWKQIGEVNAANQRIRELELAKQISEALYAKHIANLEVDKLIQLTAPMQSTLLDQNQTMHATVAQSRIPAASKSAALRKIVRPGKKLIQRMNKSAGGNNDVMIHKKLIQHFNLTPTENAQRALSAAKPKVAPGMSLPLATVISAVTAAVNEFQNNNTLVVQHAVLDSLVELKMPVYNAATLKARIATKIVGKPVALALANKLVDNIQAAEYKVTPTLITVLVNPDAFKEVYGDNDTGKAKDGVVLKRKPGKNETERITGTTSLAEVQQYQTTLTSFGASLQAKAVMTPDRAKLADLGAFGTRLQQSLRPTQHLNQRVAATLSVWSAAQQQYVPMATPGPVMAYPEFTQPMYEYLHKISQDLIIPNCNEIPMNSLTILQPNAAFIEAFMAGLNHEMARELLWREYPTDQRGSYFRKFWDTQDDLSQADPNAPNPDIKPLPEWSGNLGQNSLRAENLLVLVVRGELLQKYPNTVVYAQRGKWVDPGKKRTLCDEGAVTDTAKYRFPVIHARLDPDILLFGFNLSAIAAHGTTQDPGWFFVLKERPGQISFGLDDTSGAVAPAANPYDLTWAHFDANGAVDQVACLDVTKAKLVPGQQATWDQLTSADAAAYFFRNPMMLARHAREMIA